MATKKNNSNTEQTTLPFAVSRPEAQDRKKDAVDLMTAALAEVKAWIICPEDRYEVLFTAVKNGLNGEVPKNTGRGRAKNGDGGPKRTPTPRTPEQLAILAKERATLPKNPGEWSPKQVEAVIARLKPQKLLGKGKLSDDAEKRRARLAKELGA